MNEISQAYLLKLLEALASGPVGGEILGVARGERDLVLKENPHGAGWIVQTAPKPTEFFMEARYDWRGVYGAPVPEPVRSGPDAIHVGRTVGG